MITKLIWENGGWALVKNYRLIKLYNWTPKYEYYKGITLRATFIYGSRRGITNSGKRYTFINIKKIVKNIDITKEIGENFVNFL